MTETAETEHLMDIEVSIVKPYKDVWKTDEFMAENIVEIVYVLHPHTFAHFAWTETLQLMSKVVYLYAEIHSCISDVALADVFYHNRMANAGAEPKVQKIAKERFGDNFISWFQKKMRKRMHEFYEKFNKFYDEYMERHFDAEEKASYRRVMTKFSAATDRTHMLDTLDKINDIWSTLFQGITIWDMVSTQTAAELYQMWTFHHAVVCYRSKMPKDVQFGITELLFNVKNPYDYKKPFIVGRDDEYCLVGDDVFGNKKGFGTPQKPTYPLVRILSTKVYRIIEVIHKSNKNKSNLYVRLYWGPEEKRSNMRLKIVTSAIDIYSVRRYAKVHFVNEKDKEAIPDLSEYTVTPFYGWSYPV